MTIVNITEKRLSNIVQYFTFHIILYKQYIFVAYENNFCGLTQENNFPCF